MKIGYAIIYEKGQEEVRSTAGTECGLTYVRVGKHKTAELVKQAFMTVKGNLSDIHIFHTDRGNEFKNKTIEELLETFDMQRSLSRKGCPYDNVVAEATFKVIKTEFVWNETFHTLEELKLKSISFLKQDIFTKESVKFSL